MTPILIFRERCQPISCFFGSTFKSSNTFLFTIKCWCFVLYLSTILYNDIAEASLAIKPPPCFLHRDHHSRLQHDACLRRHHHHQFISFLANTKRQQRKSRLNDNSHNIRKRQKQLSLHGSLSANDSFSREEQINAIHAYNVKDENERHHSHIVQIKVNNLAGLVNGKENTNNDESSITINFDSRSNLIAVTGETGSGKSLLIAKVANLLIGGKATTSMVGHDTVINTDNTCDKSTYVEMTLRLYEPHLSQATESLRLMSIDPSLLFPKTSKFYNDTMVPNHEDDENFSKNNYIKKTQNSSVGILTVRRTLLLGSSGRDNKERLKSSCQINNEAIPLKKLRFLMTPLLAIVDSSIASQTLQKPRSRMSIIDAAVPPHILQKVQNIQSEYIECRKYREELQQDLDQLVLPTSFKSRKTNSNRDKNDDNDDKMLQHWLDELDEFETRINNFRLEKISVALSELPPLPDERNGSASTLEIIIRKLVSSSWLPLSDDGRINYDGRKKRKDSSSLYENIIELREAIKLLDMQIQSAYDACQALSSLSSNDSAMTAVERARNSLLDATAGSDDSSSAVLKASEISHDLLNAVEKSLMDCVKSIEDDNNGLVNTLESIRSAVPLSVEDIDIIVGDWNKLARKHGVLPYALPVCHESIRNQLDDNIEAKLLLPTAIREEKTALDKYVIACGKLSKIRIDVCQHLSYSVTQRLPSLSMDNIVFEARLLSNTRNFTDISLSTANIGVDSVDFIIHQGSKEKRGERNNKKDSVMKKGKVHLAASSGEKARILLAIETELPGSIGAACSGRSGMLGDSYSSSSNKPVAIIYDEIDAHVGGRAAVSMANMLAEQASYQRPVTAENSDDVLSRANRSQIISITHTPSVAAIADRHLVIQRVTTTPLHPVSSIENNNKEIEDSKDFVGSGVPIIATMVDGTERRQELARMASGDLATEEAEIFAAALLRDGTKARQ